MEKKRTCIRIAWLCVIMVNLISYPANSRIIEVPWKTAVLIAADVETNADVVRSYERDMKTILKGLPNCEITFINDAHWLRMANDGRKLMSLAADNGYERVIVVSLKQAIERPSYKGEAVKESKYLILKKIPFYHATIHMVIVDKKNDDEILKVRMSQSDRYMKTASDAGEKLARYYTKGRIEEIPDVVDTVIEKKPERRFPGYWSVGLNGIYPFGKYNGFAEYGLGLSGTVGFRNPWMENQYLAVNTGLYKIRTDREGMRNYMMFPISCSVGYSFRAKDTVHIEPYAGVGYIAHYVTGRFYFDPQVGAMIYVVYSIDRDVSLYGGLGYTVFFERTARGQKMSIECGYRRHFEIIR